MSHRRRRLFARRRAHPGAPPGTLVSAAGRGPPRVTMRTWDAQTIDEREVLKPATLEARDRTRAIWVDVEGLSDTDTIAGVGRAFGLHALSLEDVIEPGQRAKVERYEGYTFVMLQSLSFDGEVHAHPLALFFGDGFIVTFREPGVDPLAPVLKRLREPGGRLRTRTTDYLAYAILDSVVDHHFPVIEGLDDRIANLEDDVLEARSSAPIGNARRARRDVQTVRRVLRPTREAVAALLREDGGDMSPDTRVYLRDCYDHAVQLAETAEALREDAVELLDTYVSAVTIRTNEVMKVLTVIATIFIPLTFITGLYGMNFDGTVSPYNMPELRWRLGYPFALVLMAAIGGLFLLQMWRRGWLGGLAPIGRETPRGPAKIE